jgi:hypothetical protein
MNINGVLTLVINTAGALLTLTMNSNGTLKVSINTKWALIMTTNEV